MRAVHIIPSAFDYFTDIKSSAFNMAEGLVKLGVQVDPFTLQYGSPSKIEKSEGKSSGLPRNYIGIADLEEVLESLNDHDIIHLHAPFLGAGHRLLRYKKTHPKIKLVISVYRGVPLVDLISIYIRWYNYYYLTKLRRLADAVAHKESAEQVFSLYKKLI